MKQALVMIYWLIKEQKLIKKEENKDQKKSELKNINLYIKNHLKALQKKSKIQTSK